MRRQDIPERRGGEQVNVIVMDEALLITHASQGDALAFQRLVERYADLVSRLARTLLADRALAEDAAQEAWVDVWRSLPRFDTGQPFRPWLLTVVANRCRKAVRRRSLPTIPLDGDAFDAPDATGAVDERLLGRDIAEDALHGEALREVSAIIATLPAEQRRILALRFFADLELAEIALLTNSPLGTVKSRLSRALGVIRDRLGPERPTPSARPNPLGVGVSPASSDTSNASNASKGGRA